MGLTVEEQDSFNDYCMFSSDWRESLFNRMKMQLSKRSDITVLHSVFWAYKSGARNQSWISDLLFNVYLTQSCPYPIPTLSLLTLILFKPNFHPLCPGILSLSLGESLIFCLSNIGRYKLNHVETYIHGILVLGMREIANIAYLLRIRWCSCYISCYI